MKSRVSVAVLWVWATTACAPPIWQAASQGNIQQVEQLLSAGADPNAAGGDNTTLLHVAAILGRADMVDLLIAKGARVDAVTGRGNYTPLHHAAMNGRADAVRALLIHGADPRLLAQDKTPRALAQERGYQDIAAMLAQAEAGPPGRAPTPTPSNAPPAVEDLPPLHASVLVMELKTVGVVPPQVPSVVTKLILARLDDIEGLRTVSPEDVQLMLSVEKQKDALGCDDIQCMAEVGGALGTDLVIYGQIAVIGSQFNLSLTAIDSKRSLTVGRVSTLVAASEDALARSVPSSVASLIAKIARNQRDADRP